MLLRAVAKQSGNDDLQIINFCVRVFSMNFFFWIVTVNTFSRNDDNSAYALLLQKSATQ